MQVVGEHPLPLHSVRTGRAVPLVCEERGAVCVGEKGPERKLLRSVRDEGEGDSDDEG